MRRLILMIAFLGAMLSLMVPCPSHDLFATENGKYNILKEKIQSGEVVTGVYAAMKDPFIAQVLARAGFDFIWIDLEHTSMGWGDVERIIQAISHTRMVPIVRVTWNEHYFIKRALDIGAKGIIVPMVNSREEAVAAVQACLYPPKGIRGFGPTKAALYWGIDTKEYIKVANDEILVIVQVEHKTAVESLDKILTVDGIDLAMVGPMDLSGSMGLLGDLSNPEVVTAIDKVAEAGKKHEMPLGILSLTPEDYKSRIAQGFKFFVVGADIGIIMRGANQLHDMFRLEAK